jgi:hypothetical protein
MEKEHSMGSVHISMCIVWDWDWEWEWEWMDLNE